MAEKKEKYSFDEFRREVEKKRETYDEEVAKLFPKKIVKINDKDVDVGKIIRDRYQYLYDYAPNPKDPKLTNLVLFLMKAYKDGHDIDDITTKTGADWATLTTLYYPLGRNYRLMMDQTTNELTRLMSRK